MLHYRMSTVSASALDNGSLPFDGSSIDVCI